MFHVLGKIIMIKTDVLVIGAGPAGSSAARFAAKEGVDVIIIDKKSEIGFPKRCAEGVSKKIFDKLDLEMDPHWVTNEISGVRFVAPDGTDIWLSVLLMGQIFGLVKTKSICLMQDMCLNVRYLISIWRPLLQGKEQKSE